MRDELERVEIRAARDEELDDVAALVALSSARPETQCLHSDDDVGTARSRLEAFAAGGGRVVVAVAGGVVRGAAAADLDEPSGRGWLWGPFADDDAFDALAPRLLAALEAALPPTARAVDAFPNERNERARRLYAGRGFVERDRYHVYVAERRDAPRPDGVLEADDAAAAAAGPLHDSAFPDSYVTGADLAARRDADHRLFVVPDGSEPAGVAGYLLAERFVEDGEGFVHFLAVTREARGRGIGGRLLAAALHWLFEVEGAPRVSLTVRGDLGGAQHLYERAGFARAYTGVALRREAPAVS